MYQATSTKYEKKNKVAKQHAWLSCNSNETDSWYHLDKQNKANEGKWVSNGIRKMLRFELMQLGKETCLAVWEILLPNEKLNERY